MEISNITSLVLENIDKLLLEGRVENVKNKYPQPTWAVVDQLTEVDPSGNNKYLEWLAKRFLERTIQWFKDNASERESYYSWKLDQVPNTPEDELWGSPPLFRSVTTNINNSDLKVVKDNLEHFHENPSKYDIKDINQFQSITEFDLAVEMAKQKLSRKEQKEIGAEKIYEDDEFILILPKTHKAACRYGSNTRWCVTMRDRSSYFESYYSQGPIFFLVDKRRTPASYSPSYMEKAPDYWKIAIHYKPFNGYLSRGNQSGYLNKISTQTKEEFVNYANLTSSDIDYWNVIDDKKMETVVAKYLGGPGKGQRERSSTILGKLKSVMETYTKKILSDYYDTIVDGGYLGIRDKINDLNLKKSDLETELRDSYESLSDLRRVTGSLESLVQNSSDGTETKSWAIEQFGKSQIFLEQLNELRTKLNGDVGDLNTKIRELRDEVESVSLVFFDREKSVSIS